MFKITNQFVIRNIKSSKRLQLFSASIQTKSQEERIVSFRTSEINPENHKNEQIAQFYSIPKDIKQQLFAHGGLPKSFKEQAKTFTETCVMIREAAMDTINCLKTIDYTKPAVRFVLYGKKGSGKSLTIAHTIHYAHKSGFLIVHVPWVGNWMRRCKESSNSESKEGYIDLNLDAAAWLLHFKTQNSEILKNPNLKVSKEYVWNKRESTLKDASLIELIDHGINRVKYASDTIIALCQEIKVLSNGGKCKTLVAIDGFNAFFYPHTRIYTEKKEVVHPFKVTITEAFLNLTKSDWMNGVAVLAVDELAIAENDQISHLPIYLLGKLGFEHLDPFVPIEVKSYSSKEFRSCMDYYRERKWVTEIQGQDDELAFLSGCNPYKLMKLCASL